MKPQKRLEYDRNLTAREAGEILGLSPNSFRVYARKYRLGEKHGRDWFFSEADCAAIRRRMGKFGRPPRVSPGKKEQA